MLKPCPKCDHMSGAGNLVGSCACCMRSKGFYDTECCCDEEGCECHPQHIEDDEDCPCVACCIKQAELREKAMKCVNDTTCEPPTFSSKQDEWRFKSYIAAVVDLKNKFVGVSGKGMLLPHTKEAACPQK